MRLPSGLRALVGSFASGLDHDDLDAQVCAVELWIASGTSAERSGEHGCAHLLEHMLFKPWTRGDVASDLATEIESLGGDVNAFTSHDETVFYATAPASACSSAVAAILHATFDRSFDPDEFARERDVVIEEIKQYQDDPWSRASQALWGHLFEGHAYARPVLGTETEVAGHDVRTLAGYYRRHYRADNATLVVVGPVGVTEVEAMIADAMASAPALERSQRPRRRAKPAAARPGGSPKPIAALGATRRHVEVRREDIGEAQVLFGWSCPSLADPDCVPLDVAAIVLGSGDASRLVSRIRRKQKLVTDIGASLSASVEASALVVHAHPSVDDLAPLCAAIEAEVAELVAYGPTSEELARAVAVLESAALYRRETAQGQAHALGYFTRCFGDPGAEQVMLARLAELRIDDVRRACERWLVPARTHVVAQVPEDRLSARGATALAHRWRRDAKSPLTERRSSSNPTVSQSSRPRATTLDSGMRLVGREDPRVPIVAGWMVWPGAVASEPARLAGVSSFAANLLLRGTASHSGDALARELDGIAAVVEGFCGRNTLGMQFECRSRDLGLVLERVLECAKSASFPDDEVDDWRKAVALELAAEVDDLGQLAQRLMLRQLYGKHPYHRDPRGTLESLPRIDAAAVRRHWQAGHDLGGAVLGIAGDYDPDTVRRVLEAGTRSAGGHEVRTSIVSDPKWPARARRRELDKKREQAHIAIGYPGLRLGDPDTAALDVLTTVLGSQSGRLFAALREREGLVYHVGIHSTEGLSAGHVSVTASTSQSNLARALDRIHGELDRVMNTGIDADELTRAKKCIIGQHHAALQRRSRVAANLAFSTIYELGLRYYFEHARRVERVDAKRVAAVADRVFSQPAATALIRDVQRSSL